MDVKIVVFGLVLLTLVGSGCTSQPAQTPTQEPISQPSVFESTNFPGEIECEIDLGEIDPIMMTPLAEDIRLFEITGGRYISIESCTSPDTSDMIAGSYITCGFFKGNNEVQSIDIRPGKKVTFVVRCFGKVMNATEGVYDAGHIEIKALDKKDGKEYIKKIPLTVVVKPAFSLGKHWFSKENVSYTLTMDFKVGDTVYLTTDIENDKRRLITVEWVYPSGEGEWYEYPLYPEQTNFTVSKKLNIPGTWKVSIYINGYHQFTKNISVREE